MKILLLTTFLIVSLTGSAWARLGETEDQLIARYDKEQGGGDTTYNQAAQHWITFKKSGFQINVWLLNGVSAEEMITKISNDPLTVEECKTLLDATAQGHNWKFLTEPPGARHWQRDDGAAVAGFSPKFFQVKSKDLIYADLAAEKAGHATSLKGF